MSKKENKIDIKKLIVLVVSTVVLVVLTVIINNIEKYDNKKTVYNNKNEYADNNKVELVNDESKKESSETEFVQYDNTSYEDINNETIVYFESVEEEIDRAILSEEETISSKVKEKFILLVDFIFYGTEINGITFEELTDDTKQKLIEIVNRIDAKIEEKVPGYKETISSGAKDSYTYLVGKLKQGIDYLDEKAEEKIGTEKYDEIKENVNEAKETIKEGSTKLIDKGKQILNNAKEKVKNWYEGWK